VNDWRRLDPRVLAIRPVEGLVRAALPLLAVFLSGGRGGPGQWLSLAGAILVILAGVMHWVTTRYRISQSQVELRTGLLRRRHLSVPLDRVRSVDVTAHVMHRVLGVAVVKVGTGRQDKGRRDELRLDAVSVAEATALRAQLLHRGAASPGPVGAASSSAAPAPPAWPQSPAAPAWPEPPDSPADHEAVLSSFDPGWLRFAPFTLSGLATVGAVTGYVLHLLNEAHIDPGQVGEVRSFAGFVSRTSLPLLLLAVLAVLILLASALSTAGYLLAFWGFALTRHPGGSLHVQRGLLTTRSVSLEERRLRGVEVREPLLLRAVRGARLVAIATGMREDRGSDRGGELLHPPAPLALIHRVAGLVLHGSGPTNVPLRVHGPAARRRRYVRALGAALTVLATLAVLQVVAGLPGWPWWVAAAGVPAGAALAADRYRSLGHCVVHGHPAGPARPGTDSYLVTRHGSVDRRTAALRTDGIIGWRIRQSFFQRRAGLVTLTATTAGGHGAYRVPDVPTAEALACAEDAVPGLLRPFVLESGVSA
jgi:putative membrane protein